VTNAVTAVLSDVPSAQLVVSMASEQSLQAAPLMPGDFHVDTERLAPACLLAAYPTPELPATCSLSLAALLEADILHVAPRAGPTEAAVSDWVAPPLHGPVSNAAIFFVAHSSTSCSSSTCL